MVASRLLTGLMLFVLPPLARSLHFASVIIKASASSAPSTSRLQILPNGDLIGHSVPAVELMSLAYAVPENPSPRLSSLPDWAVRETRHQRYTFPEANDKTLAAGAPEGLFWPCDHSQDIDNTDLRAQAFVKR